jgi:hypothetical protein
MAFYLSKLRKFDEIYDELGLTAYYKIRWIDENYSGILKTMEI